MSAAGAHARASLSIGEVLGQLRPEFPDITISKIRFLEAEGLIHPERTPSGYRKFSSGDVARLRYVLAEQRDHYLPLRVIKEHLDAIDRGLEPPEGGPGTAPRRGPRILSAAEQGCRAPDAFRPEPAEVRLSRDELLASAGLEPEQLDQLEQFGLLARRGRAATTGTPWWSRAASPRWPASASRRGTCGRTGRRPTGRSGSSSRSSRR